MLKKWKKLLKIWADEGWLKAAQKAFGYLTNWRGRRDDTLWLLKRLWSSQSRLITHIHGLKLHLHYDDPGLSKGLTIYHIHEPMATVLFKKEVGEGMYKVATLVITLFWRRS